jgi:uncharacterized membrane protein YedE/YeeE
MFGIDSPFLVIGGLLAGFVFGFLLQKGQVGKYRVIVGQFLFVDNTVMKVMFTAIITGAVGVYGMLALGWLDGLMVKPALLAANALGGLIFGMGMVGLGYCPGTSVAALGEGSRSALWGILGMVAGALLFTETYPVLESGLLRVGDLGKVTLSDLTDLPPGVFVVGLVVIAVPLFSWVESLERYQKP